MLTEVNEVTASRQSRFGKEERHQLEREASTLTCRYRRTCIDYSAQSARNAEARAHSGPGGRDRTMIAAAMTRMTS